MNPIHQYPNARCYFLDENQTRTFALPQSFPLVIDGDGQPLTNFFAENQKHILEDLTTYGAVLLRGFRHRGPAEFENAALSHAGDVLKPMPDYFMSEPGRERIRGTRFVTPSNSLIATGGSFSLGGIHSENFFTPEVPNIMCFMPIRTSWMGGETCLVNATQTFEQLPRSLRDKFSSRKISVKAWSVAKIAATYCLNEEEAACLCRKHGLVIREHRGERVAVLYKPVVVPHPQTGRSAILFNISASIPGFDERIVQRFQAHFSGNAWAFHRFLWRTGKANKLRKAIAYASHPIRFRQLYELYKPEPFPELLGENAALPTEAETDAFADAVYRNATSVRWRRGDILLFDNFQMLHAGLPGFGPRNLNIMMFNPVYLDETGVVEGSTVAAAV